MCGGMVGRALGSPFLECRFISPSRRRQESLLALRPPPRPPLIRPPPPRADGSMLAQLRQGSASSGPDPASASQPVRPSAAVSAPKRRIVVPIAAPSLLSVARLRPSALAQSSMADGGLRARLTEYIGVGRGSSLRDGPGSAPLCSSSRDRRLGYRGRCKIKKS